MPYRVIKRYGHEEGWSCTFRQHRAEHSHCKFIHGYPLAIELTFECETLDHRNWVVDFGGFKPLKAWLQSIFDHKMLVATDDPHVDLFKTMVDKELADIVFVPRVGCEAFAEMIFGKAEHFLVDSGDYPRVQLASVKVSEHGGNSAVFTCRSIF
jgi:6-pyruvoyltetrahydropterin/6-carboxytetrahydropterin synthase